MINKIIEQIAKNIEKIYIGIPIYTEHIKQGFSMPSFFIRNIKNTEQRLISGRYKVFNEIEITYYCYKEGNANENMNKISQKLLAEIKTIQYEDGYIDTKNINIEFKDGDKIKINIEYEYYIFKILQESKMERMIT